MAGTSWKAAARPPAVAGMFYPAEPESIQHALTQFGADGGTPRRACRAALVPHAGWIYSGRIAAAVLSQIAMPPTILMLSPKHRAGGPLCAVAPWPSWQFPGGEVESDVSLSEELVEAIADWQLDERPHLQEHAIEVQLPLLKRFAPESRLVGVTIGRVDLDRCQAMARSLADLLRDRLEQILLVISSDMNHFAEDAENRRLDAMALEAMEQLDPEQLHSVCRTHRITMCGMLPAVIVLMTLRNLNALQRAERVAYATSADAGGDPQRVVGYAGMLFS